MHHNETLHQLHFQQIVLSFGYNFFSVWGKECYNEYKIKAPTVASLSYWRDLKCPLEALGLVCTLNIQTRVLGEKI